MSDKAGQWVRLAMVQDLAEGSPKLAKLGDARYVCVRRGGTVAVFDDRCPHQGYPLSQGVVRGNELVCQWHNWRFDLDSGECVFGGEPPAKLPAKVEDGVLYVDPTIDPQVIVERSRQGLRKALADSDVSRTVREGLRLGRALETASLGGVGPAIEALVIDAADRGEYGFEHPLAMTADVATWVERGWIDPTEALAVAAAAAGETHRNLPERPRPDAIPGDAAAPAALLEAWIDERRDEVDVRARASVAAVGPEALARRAFAPFLARHLFDYGHGLIYLAKSLEHCRRFPATAQALFGTLAVTLGWATAETALPPFTATRRALVAAAEADPPVVAGAHLVDRAAFERAVLEGEATALAAVGEALRRGVDRREILIALAHAAAERLARFDASWERDLEAEVGVLDVSHTVTFTEAALAVLDVVDAAAATAFCIQAAGFIGKVRRGDAATLPTPVATSESLLSCARARDVRASLGAIATFDAPARLEAYRTLADFAAIDAAVRPIRVAHAIKTLEALYRLEQIDGDGGDTYLRTLVCFVVPRRPEQSPRRIARVASKFLEDGRPPGGLY